MHPNKALLEQLFAALNRHDHVTMAACYDPDATFRDIAFVLPKMQSIQAMWHMICDTDIRADVKFVEANDTEGRAHIIDIYTYKKKHADPTGNPVTNDIDCRFQFREGRIIKHEDFCDPRAWANMAFKDNGVLRFLAGRSGCVRRFGARSKLKEFVKDHEQYRRSFWRRAWSLIP